MQVLVVGRAKTGTTVLSKTIHNSMPGAQYALEPKRVLFFEQPDRVGKPYVVKIIFEHWGAMPHLRDAIFFRETAMKFDKAVAIVRDPRDELISRLYYVARARVAQPGCPRAAVDAWIDVLRQKEASPASVTYEMLAIKAKELLALNVDPSSLAQAAAYFNWAQRLGPRVFLVRYEDFMAGRTHAIESYLGIPLSQDRSVGDLDYTRRTEGTNNWKSFFTPEDVDRLRPVLDPQLLPMGYTDWDLDLDPVVPAETGSEYVKKLIEPFFPNGATASVKLGP